MTYTSLVDKVYSGQITSQQALSSAFKLGGEEGVSIFMKALSEDPRAKRGIAEEVK